MSAKITGIESVDIDFPAGTVRYHRAGAEGPPVVLLHGGVADNALLSWKHTFGVLTPDHQVYAPDLPKHGGSRPWQGQVTQRTLEECLRWLLDEWGLSEVTLIGHSIGGSLAAGFALRHPHRIRQLVLIDSHGLQPKIPWHKAVYFGTRGKLTASTLARAVAANESFAKWFLTKTIFTGTQPTPDLDELVDQTRQEARENGSVLADWMSESLQRQSTQVNHLPHLGYLRCPTLITHGENDKLVPLSYSREAAGAIPGSRLRIVPDAGHRPHRERPNEFNAYLREFLNEQR